MPVRQERTKNKLNCTCRHHPLLAMWGLDTDGRPYVHVKVFKGGRLYAEVFSKHTLQITCRDCFRKLNIIIRQGRAELTRLQESEIIAADVREN